MQPQVSFGFIEPLYILAFNLMVVFYRMFGENLGFAIIFFTLFVRFLTLPFAIRQVRSAKQNQEFQAKYKQIQAQYKDDKEAQMRELGRLQAEFLPGQLGGCLPLILNVLFFFQVFFVINNILPHAGQAADVGSQLFNQVNYGFVPEFQPGYVINTDFFGIDLGKSAASIGLNNFGQVWPYLLLVILVGITTFISGRVTAGLSTLPTFNKNGKSQDVRKGKNGKPLTESEKKKLRKVEKAKKQAIAADNEVAKQEEVIKVEARERKTGKDSGKKSKDGKQPEDMDFSTAMQQSSQQMLYILPIMQMLISFAFPAGLSLYSTISGGFAIIQQLIVNREKVSAWVGRFTNRLRKRNNTEVKIS